MKISIVILHFGALTVTQQCVESLRIKEKHPFSLIIVNNTTEPLSKKNFPNSKNCTIINNERNLGFAAGVNKGIRFGLYQKADAIMLLNNDTKIEKPLLQILSDSLQKNKSLGIVAPALAFRKKGKLFYDIGGKVNPSFGKTSHTEVVEPPHVKTRNVEYVSGCCMLIKKEVFQKVGLFDDQFFLYYEDVDFCLRAQKKGFSIAVVPTVSIYHELSKSAGKLSSLAIHHQLRSAVLFGKKYYKGFPNRLRNMAFILLQILLFFKVRPMQTFEALLTFVVKRR